MNRALLTALFVLTFLKLAGFTTLSWWWVLSPALLDVVGTVLMYAVLGSYLAVIANSYNKTLKGRQR